MFKKLLKINRFTLATYSLFGFLFWHFGKEMLQVKENGWYVGHINLWGDLLLHLSFINKFLVSGQILPISPIFPDTKPNYPIFADYVTAILARFTGVDFALFFVTFTVGIILIYTSRIFIKTFIRNEAMIFLSLLIFFFNGGLGFHYFFQDYVTSGESIFQFLTQIPREYTNIKDQDFWWINNYLAYFLPQRGLLFAFPITLLVFSLLYTGFKEQKRQYFILAALLSGSLTLVQAHSLFVIFLVCAISSIFMIVKSKFDKKTITNWLIFAALTTTVALPLFNSITSSTSALSHIRFDPGWTSQENIIWFWFKNLGIFAPVLTVAIFWLFKKNRLLFLLYLPFLLIFFLSNIFVFQPWDFDNSKLLIYWHFASAIVVAYFLVDQFFSEDAAKKIAGILIVLSMIFSGALDIFRTFTPVTNYQIFTKKDLEVAQSVKNFTSKDAIFLTASNHTHPIPALTGRSTLVGFHGWLWSHGLPYQERVNATAKIYLGDIETEELIAKYKVSYVTVGPNEKATFSINQSYFEKYPKIYLDSEWQLYDVSNLWSHSDR